MISRVSSTGPSDIHRAFGFEQIADCGSMRVVGLATGTRAEHTRASKRDPRRADRDEGRLHFDDGLNGGEVGAGEMMLINPGERHTYRADVETSAYLVFAGLPESEAACGACGESTEGRLKASST